MTTPQHALPKYNSQYFVARTVELDKVLEKARSVINAHKRQTTEEQRTVIFMGQRNLGKTWLMGKLAEELNELDIDVLELDIEAYCRSEKESKNYVEKVIKKIIDDAAEKLKLQHPKMQVKEAKEITGKSKVFIEALQEKLKEKPLAVLLDSVFEADWEILSKLEDYFLGPLAIEPCVLPVLTGRGRAYPWKTPELRLRADFNDLTAFTREETQEQLNKIAEIEGKADLPQKSEDIYKYSKGNPGAIRFLAQTPDNLAAGINKTIDDILAVAENDAPLLRKYLTALSPLRTFDEERIPVMLAAAYPDNDSYEQLTYREAREIREMIVKYAFTRWDDKSGGYKLDDTIANLLEEYLKHNEKETWQRLHCAAYRLYKGWAEQYPATKDTSLEEADYHQEQLEEADFSIDQCNT